MSNLVSYQVDDGIAIITIDNPPVNALGPGVPESLQAALERLMAEDTAKGAILIGAGRTFIAGADIKQLAMMAIGRADRGPGLSSLLALIENCPKPVVCAIHGTALGGGLEIALSCHYRVALDSAKVGLPEVKIGLIPGAEGTQRLPRLIGMAPAAEICATGRMVAASEALQLGILDQLFKEDLENAAQTFLRGKIESAEIPRKTRELNDKLTLDDPTRAALEKLRQQVTKKARGMPAPGRAIDSVALAASQDFQAGCREEAERFDACLNSPEAKGLMHVFFSERATTKIPDLPSDLKPGKIQSAAVIGAGTMGGGITMCYANAGIPVVLKEVDQAALDHGLDLIKKNYAASVKRGRSTPQQIEERLGRITPTLDYKDIGQADIIVEAVFENLELKKRVFGEIDKSAKPEAILATNTSTLDIDQIAQATTRPESVIGTHFFSPANVMKLLEIVRGSETSPQVIATCLALAKKLRKVGVVVRNCFGFVGNRMFTPYTNEAQFLVEEGASVAQVDQVLYEFGWAMGPMAVFDLAGNDVGWRIHQETKDTLPEAKRHPLMMDVLYHEKRWGQKTGKGWYRYVPGERRGLTDDAFEARIHADAERAGIAQRTITNTEILERTLYALINEGARILEEGYAIRSSDIDIIYIYGYGFPAFRGGPMHYADQIGLKTVYERVCELEKEHGFWWQPAPLLKSLAEDGRSFADFDRS